MNKRKIRPNHQIAGKIGRTCIILLLTVTAIIQIFPFYFTIIHSLQPSTYVPVLNQLNLWPESFHPENYLEAWKQAKLGMSFLNSLVYVTIFTVVSGIIAMLVGYVIAKKRFRGRKVVFILLLSTMMVPGEVLLAPNYLITNDLHMTNSLIGLIYPGLVNIMGVFIAKQFMESIPDSILEAATIDGCGEWRKFVAIAFPMAMSAFASYFIITFVSTWNDYLWPMIILTDSSKYPVQLAVQSFVKQNMGANEYYNVLKDAAVIATLLPVVIVYFIFQKRFVEGLAISGIK